MAMDRLDQRSWLSRLPYSIPPVQSGLQKFSTIICNTKQLMWLFCGAGSSELDAAGTWSSVFKTQTSVRNIRIDGPLAHSMLDLPYNLPRPIVCCAFRSVIFANPVALKTNRPILLAPLSTLARLLPDTSLIPRRPLPALCRRVLWIATSITIRIPPPTVCEMSPAVFSETMYRGGKNQTNDSSSGTFRARKKR